MRTTLTIDDDVAAQLDRLRRGRNLTLKAIVNEALRRGLRDVDAPQKKRTPFRTKVFGTGKPLIPNVDNVAEVIAFLEGEDFK
jgi:hypothetical protein